MATIDQLSAVSTVTDGDLFALFSTSNGDARKASIAVLADYIAARMNANGSTSYVTQYAAPSATAFTVVLNNTGGNAWLILTPLASYASGAITLPAATVAVDKQEILVNTTQAVTTFTVNGNGTTVNGAPTTLAANSFFRLRFDGVLKVWYRVG